LSAAAIRHSTTLNLQPVATICDAGATAVRDFRRCTDSVNKMFAMRDEGKINFQVGQVTVLKGADGQPYCGNAEKARMRDRHWLQSPCCLFRLTDWKLGHDRGLEGSISMKTDRGLIPKISRPGIPRRVRYRPTFNFWYPGQGLQADPVRAFMKPRLMTQAVQAAGASRRRLVFPDTTFRRPGCRRSFGVQ